VLLANAETQFQAYDAAISAHSAQQQQQQQQQQQPRAVSAREIPECCPDCLPSSPDSFPLPLPPLPSGIPMKIPEKIPFACSRHRTQALPTPGVGSSSAAAAASEALAAAARLPCVDVMRPLMTDHVYPELATPEELIPVIPVVSAENTDSECTFTGFSPDHGYINGIKMLIACLRTAVVHAASVSAECGRE
jgi:hypothetical protein